jgi:hypothetical protein
MDRSKPHSFNSMPGSSKPIGGPPSVFETAPSSKSRSPHTGEAVGSPYFDFVALFAVALSFGTVAHDEHKPKFRAWTGHFLGIL